jgi:hypothetical protein
MFDAIPVDLEPEHSERETTMADDLAPSAKVMKALLGKLYMILMGGMRPHLHQPTASSPG